MARTAKPATRQTTAKARKPAASPAAKRQPKPKAAPARKPKAPKAAAPRLGVTELRAQLEKLQNANTALRAKNRDAGRVAKTAAARIAELEEEVARLQKAAASGASARERRQGRRIDPGDAVPPGVAVETPEPPDYEAETARENLETHLAEE